MIASQNNKESGDAEEGTESWNARDYLLVLCLFLGGCLGLLTFDKYTFRGSKAVKDAGFPNAQCTTPLR